MDRRDRTSTDVIEEQFDNLVEANDILLERVVRIIIMIIMSSSVCLSVCVCLCVCVQGNLLDKASGKGKEKEKVDVNEQALTDVTIATWNDKVITHTLSFTCSAGVFVMII